MRWEIGVEGLYQSHLLSIYEDVRAIYQDS